MQSWAKIMWTQIWKIYQDITRLPTNLWPLYLLVYKDSYKLNIYASYPNVCLCSHCFDPTVYTYADILFITITVSKVSSIRGCKVYSWCRKLQKTPPQYSLCSKSHHNFMGGKMKIKIIIMIKRNKNSWTLYFGGKCSQFAAESTGPSVGSSCMPLIKNIFKKKKTK